MAMVDAAVTRWPAALLAADRPPGPSDHTQLFLLAAIALIVAAATWLAFEVHRIWTAEARVTGSGSTGAPGDGLRRRTAGDDHPLVPQLVEEIIRLNALVTELRDARVHAVGEQDDADLATWALAGLEARIAGARTQPQESVEARDR